jgi:surface carbohydrate biosynthesis protein
MTTRITKRRWLILPVETKARELHAKMLLACVAAERGWGVIVGGKSATRGSQKHLPRGTFLEKSVALGRMPTIVQACAAGNRVSALCEEGLFYLNIEDYRKKRLERESFNAVDYFFTWGARQTQDIREIMKADDTKVVVSGNPRFDLLRPEFRRLFLPAAQRIKKRYGKIVLVNTKFVSFNNGMPAARDRVAYLKSRGFIVDQEQEELLRKVIRLQEKVFAAFFSMIKRLSAEFPDYTVVVRPHPGEDDTPWIEGTKALPNVCVVYEGSVNEWLLAAELSIHNNCTTGVEAFLLGRPTISYRPARDEAAEFLLPRKVGFSVETEDELVTCVRGILKKEVDTTNVYQQQRSFVQDYVANLDGPLACETILKTLETLDLPQEEFLAAFSIGARLRALLRVIKRRLVTPDRAHNYYVKKFPGIGAGEVQEMLKELRQVSGRFADVRIVQISDSGFCITKGF